MDRKFNDHHLNAYRSYDLPLNLSDLTKVDEYTRAGKYGKAIICPECKNMEIVYHFAWCDIICQECQKMINKYDYCVFSEGNG